MRTRNPATLQVTKYFLDKGADLDLANSMIFEVAPPRQLERQGIADLVEKGTRDSDASSSWTSGKNERSLVGVRPWASARTQGFVGFKLRFRGSRAG
jgi:hypothetical protein